VPDTTAAGSSTIACAGAESPLETWVEGLAGRHPMVGLAVGVVRDGRLDAFRGYGLADIASGRPIAEDPAFRIASITKTFTAIAAMQLWEQGLIDLDAPVGEYLRAYRLVPANVGWRPATVRHLLTHTAGLPEVRDPRGALQPDFGESVPAGRLLPSLADFYGGRLRVSAEPGTRFVYGNHSPATLGQLVEDVTGLSLGRVFRERIFEPLGMVDTTLIRPDRAVSRTATGYTIGRRGPRAVPERDMVTTGAAGIHSTPHDMARYVAALLGGGANEHGSVLRPSTVSSMFEPHYQPDPRLPGFGLGFFRADLAGHRVVRHQGVIPGFDSEMALVPDDGIGLVAFTNGARDAALWLPAEMAALLRRLMDLPGDGIRSGIAPRPDAWGDLCGWYQLDAGLSDVRLRAMMGAGLEILAADGGIRLRFLSPIPMMHRAFALHPDDAMDPTVYRMDLSAFGLGTTRVAFSRGPGGARSVTLELMPLILRRQPSWTNPRVWATGSLAALGLGAAALILGRRRSAR
jgi:CubicO group peptidase (beta-lactamase class C family)